MSTPVQLSHNLIDEITNCLASDQGVQLNLDGGLAGTGRIFIDRPQPFLCVYRAPQDREDLGTETLLLGQASYVIASGNLGNEPLFRTLITSILSVLQDRFGATLLLDFGAFESDDQMPEAQRKPPAQLQITAPAHNVPALTLATLERASLSANWPLGGAETDVCYSQAPTARGHPPLLTPRQIRTFNVSVFSLEVSADYRNRQTGAVYPEILNVFQTCLTHILKQMAFAFVQETSRYTLAHFHETGPRALDDGVLEVDRALSTVSGAFDLLLHISPVNSNQAWQDFRRNQFEKAPEFHYRALPVDPGALKHDLFSVKLDRIEDPALFELYRAKRDELDRELTLLADRERPEFLYGSLALFGHVEDWLLDLARKILMEVPPHTHDDNVSDNVSAEELATHAREEIAWYAGQDPTFTPKVEVRADVPGLMVSRGNFLIPEKSRVARARVDAAINHEIGTHAVTYYNGRKQPLHQFQNGAAGYEELQEGLAVFSEFLVGGLSRPRFRQLAGRVVAARSMIDGADFVETYQVLHNQFEFAQHTAYMMTMRTFRGGGYVKDQIYLRGLVRLLQKLHEGVTWETLWVGKIAFDQIDIVEELLWRKVLSRDIVQPKYMERDGVQEKLNKVREGADIFDLIATAKP